MIELSENNPFTDSFGGCNPHSYVEAEIQSFFEPLIATVPPVIENQPNFCSGDSMKVNWVNQVCH